MRRSDALPPNGLDYQDVDRVVVPMTIEAFQNGRLFTRCVVKELRSVDRFDASVFQTD